MTYSIVALDPVTGEIGVGVQTHRPAVGAIVPWVSPGIGGVATQAMANARYGPQALALLENGLDAEHALAAILAGDDERERRQVAIVDSSGGVAVFTGSEALKACGSVQGEGFSCQANMMAKDGVPEAMAADFEDSSGPLERRILSALDAAQTAGGDARGMQSAAILVRPAPSEVEQGPYFVAPGTNFRVDHSADPLADMRALLDNRDAEAEMRDEETVASLEKARAAYERRRGEALTDELAYWHAVRTLSVRHGQHDEAVAILEPIIARNPNWATLMHNLPDVPKDSPLLARFKPAGG